MTGSRSLPLKTRFLVLKRDGFRCQYCGALGKHAALEVDHRTPVALGGSDDPANLVTSCMRCNRGKGTLEVQNPPLVSVTLEDLQAALAMTEGFIEDRFGELKYRPWVIYRLVLEVYGLMAEAVSYPAIRSDLAVQLKWRRIRESVTESLRCLYEGQRVEYWDRLGQALADMSALTTTMTPRYGLGWDPNNHSQERRASARIKGFIRWMVNADSLEVRADP